MLVHTLCARRNTNCSICVSGWRVAYVPVCPGDRIVRIARGSRMPHNCTATLRAELLDCANERFAPIRFYILFFFHSSVVRFEIIGSRRPPVRRQTFLGLFKPDDHPGAAAQNAPPVGAGSRPRHATHTT